MNCPKCNTQINETDYICPNCKKVLKIKCPKCGTLSKKSTCPECETVLLDKCYKCGKLNLVENKTCSKCGMNINTSIILKESVIEEFAVLTIEITNLDEIKEIFKSEKLKEQFKQNIYQIIKKPANQKKLRVQLVENTFIIRFNKDYNFTDSCLSAVDFSIYIAQSLTLINKKLMESKGIAIKAQMAIQKRDVYAKQNEYKSGININVVYSACKASHIFNNIEIVADYYVYDETKAEYPFQSLSAVYIKDRMVLFFELILHKLIKLKNEKQSSAKKMQLPKSADYIPEEDTEEMLMNFSGMNCTFATARGENLLSKLENINKQNVQNPIISIKTEQKNKYLSFISDESLKNIFNDTNIIRFNCPQNTKYSIYGLLKQMLFEYKHKTKEDFWINPDTTEYSENMYIESLLLMSPQDHSHPEDLKYSFYEAFSMFVRSIPFKTIFVIDDFHNADETSVEIIKYLIESNELGNIGFIVTNNNDFLLHRKIHSLMTNPNYFEIEMKSSPNKAVINQFLSQITKLEDTFFLEKILENTKGSYLYFEQALLYLVDENVLEFKDQKYHVKKDNMVVIPKDFDELIQKRISSLRNKPEIFELFVSMVLMSEKISLNTLNFAGFDNYTNSLKILSDKKLINVVNNTITINNYNIFKQNLEKVCTSEEIEVFAQSLLDRLYEKMEIPSNTKAELLEYAKLKKEAFTQWHSLAMISSQLGDFCAYLNCTNKFLSLVDNVIDEDTDKSVDEIKFDVYSELASMLYKYYPDKIITFLEMILANFEEKNDDVKIKEISNKLVQSCLISGNYHNALEYIGKIISRTKRSSFNPSDSNFNLNYFLLNLVTIEIYFNLGRLNECIDLGNELFKYINLFEIDENILPEGFSKKQFENTLFDALFLINLARIIQMKPDASEHIEILCKPESDYQICFTLLKLLLEFMKGIDIIPVLTEIAKIGLPDKYSQILFPFLQALISMVYRDWNNFGNYIYNAKLKALAQNMQQFNYFFDLMIGYAYQNLQNTKKAKQIYYDVLDIASEKGFKYISYVCWNLMAQLETFDTNHKNAINILNNSILKIENDENISELFAILFKSLYAEIVIKSNYNDNPEKVLVCIEQAYKNALKNQFYLYLPQMAEILMFIYSQIVQSPQPKEIIAEYNAKIQNLQKTMNAIFPAPAQG